MLGMRRRSRPERDYRHVCTGDGTVTRAAIRALIVSGDDRSEGFDLFGACEDWLEAWSAIFEYARSRDLRSIDAVQEEFPGEKAIIECRWQLQDALWCAGQLDRAFWERSLTHFQQFLEQFTSERRLVLEHTRHALGTTHAVLGQHDRADTLFRRWLDADPEWAGGWIAWSDCFLFNDDRHDEERAQNLLLQGLAVPGNRDEPELLRQLSELYETTGRHAEAAQARVGEQDAVRREDVGSEPSRESKVGRHELCPCGGGKSYKKCCGSRGSV